MAFRDVNLILMLRMSTSFTSKHQRRLSLSLPDEDSDVSVKASTRFTSPWSQSQLNIHPYLKIQAKCSLQRSSSPRRYQWFWRHIYIYMHRQYRYLQQEISLICKHLQLLWSTKLTTEKETISVTSLFMMSSSLSPLLLII